MRVYVHSFKIVLLAVLLFGSTQVSAKVSFRDNLLEILESVSRRFMHEKGQFERYEDVLAEQKRINDLETEKEKLVAFHRSFSSERFVVLDTQTEIAEVYNEQAELIEAIFWPVDKKEDFYFSGRFQLGKPDPENIILIDDRDKEWRVEPLYYVNLPSQVYVLPQDPGLGFIVRDGQLEFQSLVKRQSYTDYNLTRKSYKYREVKIVILKNELHFDEVVTFLKTLEVEKKNLMQLYKITNDEFNQMVKLAFGIMGNESEYGNGIKYAIKETLPGAVALAKNIMKYYRTGEMPEDMFDQSMNSRGLTQIKKVPKLIKSFYNIKKENLYKPREAAIATVGFLAQTLQEVKYMGLRNDFITYKNRMDMVPFIYSGRMRLVIQKKADPEKLNYLIAAKKKAKSIAIYQRID